MKNVMTQDRPLCVDLDGTLIRTDLLYESIFILFRKDPFRLLSFFFLLLMRGRAAAKKYLSTIISFEGRKLPMNSEVIDAIETAKIAGRPTWLVTASPEKWAHEVASMVPGFTGVIGSNASINLKGSAKSLLLSQKFGEKGFDYIGDSTADRAVWKLSYHAIIVGSAKRLFPNTGNTEVTELKVRKLNLKTFVKLLRVHQWAKNILIFIPLFLAHRYTEQKELVASLAGFVCFSLCASGVYVVNDLMDLDSDRHHPTKYARPIAGGAISIPFAVLTAILLFGGSLALALTFMNLPFLLVLGLYFVVTTAYSLSLKEKLGLDTVTLAVLYTIRILAGHAAASISISHWLLAFSMFIFLSLGFVKRTSELLVMKKNNNDSSRGRAYRTSDLPIVQGIGAGSGLISILIFVLYLDSTRAAEVYQHPNILWAVIPFLLYWICRTWLLASRGEIHEDPVTWALRDRISYVVALSVVMLIFIARGTLWLNIW